MLGAPWPIVVSRAYAPAITGSKWTSGAPRLASADPQGRSSCFSKSAHKTTREPLIPVQLNQLCVRANCQDRRLTATTKDDNVRRYVLS